MPVTKSTPPFPLSLVSPLIVKPHPTEALLRLRYSSIALLVIVLVSILVPLPTPIDAWRTVKSGEGLWRGLSSIELSIICLLSLNISQSLYALKYPPPPNLPTPRPQAPFATPTNSASPATRRKLGGLSPHTSPQPQKSFSQSFSSSYASSPISTPSRMLNYTVPSPSPSLNDSFGANSSIGSSVGAGSPLAQYRGKKRREVGRALEGSFLASLSKAREDDEEQSV